jgi:ABC-type glutathione transport system ATPase component
VNLDRLYFKVYVAEYRIGKLRLGLPAWIYTDAFPNRDFEAMVRYISSRAEFTVKEVQTILKELTVNHLKSGKPELEDIFVGLLWKNKLIEEDPSEAIACSSTCRFVNRQHHDDQIAIKASGLAKRFGNFYAVNNLSFQVRQGETFGLLGANGAGKTTAIKMLTVVENIFLQKIPLKRKKPSRLCWEKTTLHSPQLQKSHLL